MACTCKCTTQLTGYACSFWREIWILEGSYRFNLEGKVHPCMTLLEGTLGHHVQLTNRIPLFLEGNSKFGGDFCFESQALQKVTFNLKRKLHSVICYLLSNYWLLWTGSQGQLWDSNSNLKGLLKGGYKHNRIASDSCTLHHQWGKLGRLCIL